MAVDPAAPQAPGTTTTTTGTGDGGGAHTTFNVLSFAAGACGLAIIVSGVIISAGFFGAWETREFFVWGPTLFSFGTGMQAGKRLMGTSSSTTTTTV